MFHANRPSVGLERVVIRKPIVHSDRRLSIKLRKKRQFLQMVGEPISPDDRRNVRASEWVTYFKIILAAAYPRVTPCWRRIIAKRIIHPFPYLMSSYRGVVDGSRERARCLEINEGVGLYASAFIRATAAFCVTAL